MNTIKIALLGAGTVGSGVIRTLSMNADTIAARSGARIEIKKVLVRDAKKHRPEADGIVLTDNFDEILHDDEISIVVEVMGGLSPARDYMLRAMAAGKHVVTANKDVIAQHLSELYAAADENCVDFLYEASVGGGIPIIKPLKECLTANKISEIMGVVNGTTNYMLTKMTEKHVSYDAVLRRAQEKGYAEANPSADVDGLDAARKAAILASLAFDTVVEFEDVSVEGISHITEDDIEYGLNLGYVIKLLAVAIRKMGLMSACIRYSFRRRTLLLPSVGSLMRSLCAAMLLATRCFTGAERGLCQRHRQLLPILSILRGTSLQGLQDA